MVGRLLLVDTLAMRFHEVGIDRDPACAWCATRERLALLEDYAAFCGEGAAATAAADAAAMPEETARDIDPRALATRLARGDALAVLDVREPWEHAIGQLEGSLLMPMGRVPAESGALPRDRTIVVACHHGTRSAMVAEYLRASGFRAVLNLTGGIDRWSVEVDPSVPRY
jgi:sulfur-carrier protein adenylyltransferase/sulfurtransferase